jgi:hypothetical protein
MPRPIVCRKAEDHSSADSDFEGLIPDGRYGGGIDGEAAGRPLTRLNAAARETPAPRATSGAVVVARPNLVAMHKRVAGGSNRRNLA